MSNWLANATGIHISPRRTYVDRQQLGGAVKTLAPLAAAFAPGIGWAALAGGLGSGLGRAIQPGTNIGDIAKSGAIGAGESAAMGALRGAFAPSSASSTFNGYVSAPGGGYQAVGSVAGPQSALSKIADGAGSTALRGVKALGTESGLKMAGNVASGVLDARALNAKTGLEQQQFDLQRQQYDDQEARRKRLQELLAPLLSGYTVGGR